MAAIADKSQACGDFISWLLTAKGIVLASWHKCGEDCRAGCIREDLTPIFNSTTDLLAEYFEIDQAALEREKLEMLKDIREATNQGVLA